MSDEKVHVKFDVGRIPPGIVFTGDLDTSLYPAVNNVPVYDPQLLKINSDLANGLREVIFNDSFQTGLQRELNNRIRQMQNHIREAEIDFVEEKANELGITVEELLHSFELQVETMSTPFSPSPATNDAIFKIEHVLRLVPKPVIPMEVDDE